MAQQLDNPTALINRKIAALREDYDTPLNPPALDVNGNLPATILVRTGTVAQLDVIVLGNGELAVEVDGTGSPVRTRMGDGVTAGGVASLGAFRYLTVGGTTSLSSSGDIDLSFTIELNASSVAALVVEAGELGESLALRFPAFNNGSYEYSFVATSGSVPTVVTKETTGDPAAAQNGVMCINTFDNNVKIYADGGWRQLASW